MPQNALGWHRLGHMGRNQCRRRALRVGTSLTLRRSSAVVRISTAIPAPVDKPTLLLPNVLDEGFESAAPLGSIGCLTGPARGPYVLVAGPLAVYKNIGTLLAGFYEYLGHGGSLELVIAGPRRDTSTSRLVREADAVCPRVHGLIRDLARNEVAELMRGARGVLFPSLVEASPITLLEACALQSHVAASDIPGHRDTLSFSGVHDVPLFDPREPTSIRLAIERITEGTRPIGAPIVSAKSRSKLRYQWAYLLKDWLSRLIS
jgi:glycosyltransferase involved in cell wall biosynthesis